MLLLFKNIIAAVAQLVVHLICNQGVVGSSPIGGTNLRTHRLTVRTHPFHGWNRDSNSLGFTNLFYYGFVVKWRIITGSYPVVLSSNLSRPTSFFGTIAGRSSIGLLILRRGFDSLWSYHIVSIP